MKRLALPILAACTAAVLTVACDDHDDDEQCPDEHGGESADEHGETCGEEEGEFGPPTESVCPEGSTLTWESFGQSFMQTYCTRCHASTLMGADRQGAPLYHDFDTLEGVLVVADHVDMKAASGPGGTNELMPISAPTPSLMERQQLGEWLACELAKM